MRSYVEVFVDVQDGKDVDKEELRVALMFCRDMLFFAEQDVNRLIQSIKNENGQKLQAIFAEENINNRFQNRKNPLEKWWGGIEKVPVVNKI